MAKTFTLKLKEDVNAAFSFKGFAETEMQEDEGLVMYASVVINTEEIENYITENYPEAADVQPRTGYNSSTHEAFIAWSTTK